MEGSVTKGEFAALIGVSPGRVSQYLAEGKITPAALVGSGRSAKILVDRAKADLRMTLDVAQRLGNGITTRIDDFGDEPDTGFVLEAPSPGEAQKSAPAASATGRGGIDYEIKQQKLDQLRRANRNAAIADAQAAGTLTEAEAARAAMTRVANGMMLVFEGGLTDFASAIAAEFKVPQRDVLHLLRRQFRAIRESAAKAAKAEAVDMAETVETEIQAADEIEAIN